MPTTTTLVAHAPLATVATLLRDALTGAGWRVTTSATNADDAANADGDRTDGVVLGLTRGDRWRTRLLGAAAGDSFYLSQTVTLTPTTSADEAAAGLSLLGGPVPAPGTTPGPVPGTTLIEYPTSGAQAITRGGVFGADLEMRTHESTTALLTSTLRAAGVTVGHA